MTGPIKSEIRDREDNFLTGELFGEVYGRLGSIFHANDPIGDSVDYDYWMVDIPKWMNLIINFLNSHKVRLLSNPIMFLIHMNDESDGNVKGYEFQPLGPTSTQGR